jgi:hypothetical protein
VEVFDDRENFREKMKERNQIEEEERLDSIKKLEDEAHEIARDYELQQEAQRLQELRRQEDIDMANRDHARGSLRQMNDNARPNWRALAPHYDDDLDMTVTDAEALGLTEDELDNQCEDLFLHAPIPFVAMKGDPIQELIEIQVSTYDITIPVINIKDSLYLIGTERINLELRNDAIVMRVGSGYKKFQDYVPQNSRHMQRMLVIYMHKSGESLEYVIDCLKNNKRIKNVQTYAAETKKYSRKNSYSRTSKSPLSRLATNSGISPGRTSYLQRKEDILSTLRDTLGTKSNTRGDQKYD